MTSEDFSYLATLIRDNRDNTPVYRALMSNNCNTILAALGLAPVARAAIAYHDAPGGSSWNEARALDDAIETWKAAER